MIETTDISGQLWLTSGCKTPEEIADFWTENAGRIADHEGFRPNPYLCSAGKLTIGYGCNLQDKASPFRWTGAVNPLPPLVIDRFTAFSILKTQIRNVGEELGRYAKGRGILFTGENDTARAGALLNMAFQLGMPSCKGFPAMWAALERYDYAAAADEMLDSRWHTQTPARCEEMAAAMRFGFFNG